RIDMQNGIVRIVDYKTGKCKVENLAKKLDVTLDSLFISTKDKFPKEAFQTLLYAYILKKMEPEKTFQPNLFFIQTINDKNNRTTLKINKNEVLSFEGDLEKEFETGLQEKITELLDTNRKFEQTENRDNVCCYCDFKEFCGRNETPKQY
ncbi:MAG: PD-(D/E)XK nuclease family protein, partial [Bacteroidales bacterium]|nr:PD-(D/E)XK nuclease family protein [Bacteroidales bacterium]